MTQQTRRCCPGRRQESETCNQVQRIGELRNRKGDLLFEFLRNVQEINRQIKVLGIKEEMAEINRTYDKALMDLFVREGK